MQSACLLSDMEAFKAANPGCCLGDFVRWYSPRDWVLDDETENSSNSENQKIKGRLNYYANCFSCCRYAAKPRNLSVIIRNILTKKCNLYLIIYSY